MEPVNKSNEQVQLHPRAYHSPVLTDFGQMSEMTKALSGPGTGCDGAYPSYLTQSSGGT